MSVWPAAQTSWKSGSAANSRADTRGSGSSRARSDNLDNLLNMAEKLRNRGINATQDCLPELGAILGRGSFGKVYKGAPSHQCPIARHRVWQA